MPFTLSACFNALSFSVFRRSMMQDDELPLTDAIDDERFESVFEDHEIDFGNDDDAVYTPAITLWVPVHANPASVRSATARQTMEA